MDISQPELERLRAQIREVVIAVLRRREAQGAAGQAGPEGRTLIVLFTLDLMPGDDFFAEVASLAGQGYRIVAAPSHTFSQFHGNSVLEKLPKGTGLLQANDEKQQSDAVRSADALIAAFVSTNTASKVAAGIEDSMPSRLIRGMLMSGKPVCVATDLSAHRQMIQDGAPGAAHAIVRVADDHLHKLQQMGVRFTSGNLASCIAEIFRPEINETPERLAKQRMAPKRQFITAEDVWNAMSRGQKELLYTPGTVITDEAREYAASRGIVLREK
ncbi:MAG: hypothetical protein ACR2IE_06175 [Candidatus Sumerlaeaceae bacterium]